MANVHASAGPPLIALTALPGFVTKDGLVDRYAQSTRRGVDALECYEVLAMWKLAVLLEGSCPRRLASMTDGPFFGELEQVVPALARRAVEVCVR
jgi:aminoglycoside phosphotransferase (APT) family kinase protein